MAEGQEHLEMDEGLEAGNLEHTQMDVPTGFLLYSRYKNMYIH